MSRIILVGAHGVGKTSLSQELKKRHEEYMIRDGISRPIKRVKERTHLTDKEEQIIVNELTFFYYNYNKDLKNVIINRSPIDVVAYSGGRGWKDLEEECEERFKQLDFKDTVFCYIPIEFEIEDDGVRFTDKGFQKEIDERMKELMKKYGIKYITVGGTVEERIKKIEEIM